MTSRQAIDQRNRYFRHRHLIADDYGLEQAYGIERRRLLSRVIVGWGVARGFALTVEANGDLTCGSGLALDRHGRELVRRSAARVADGEVVRLGENGQPASLKDEEIGQRRPYLLQAHYAERLQGAVRAGSVCDCGKKEWNFVEETVLFSLRPVPPDWNKTAQQQCKAYDRVDENRQAPDTTNRRPHAGLCAWSRAPLPADLDAAESHGHVCYQLADPVPLAVVWATYDKCGTPSFSELDACTPRRVVKTNDMLFDLIRGCDLTTITGVSWVDWHNRSVEWEDFLPNFPKETATTGLCDRLEGDTDFVITFSRPVQVETLHASCVSFRVLAGEGSGGWMDVKQIPVAGLAPGDVENGCSDSARIQVRSDWCDDEIWGRHSVFDQPTHVEIEIRGDLILDCNGQAVDATPAGPDRLPSGNGTPGGTYFSSFKLQKRT